jgi:hypothetical protein
VKFQLRRGKRTTEPEPLDGEDVAWVAAGRHPFHAYDVGSLVPGVFERYARVLHPAATDAGAPVRWDMVAAWSGRTAHALAQWDALSRPVAAVASDRPFQDPPGTDGLREPHLAALCDLLSAHTATRDDCYIGVWHGFGWLDRSDLLSSPELDLDQRTYLVRRGPIETAREIGWRHFDGSFESEPPNLVWPADRAWFVAGDVDLDSTYLGGSGALIDALLADPRLEAWEVHPADGVTADSDHVNGSYTPG